MLPSVLQSLSPVFPVIAVGFLARRRGWLPEAFAEAANRLVYNLGIPLLIFAQVAPGDFSRTFRPAQIAAVLAAVLAAAALALLLAALLRLPAATALTFAQDSFHGNTGFIALAVLRYVLGPEGLAAGSVLAGFTMLINNTLALALFTLLAAPPQAAAPGRPSAASSATPSSRRPCSGSAAPRCGSRCRRWRCARSGSSRTWPSRSPC